MNETNNNFVGYEYTTVTVKDGLESMVMDGYQSFGWKPEGRDTTLGIFTSGLKFKRDRKIRNKAELSRLQREFDNHIKEIENLEDSKKSGAQIIALVIGIIGAVFMAGAMFSFLAEMIPLMIILAVPAFIAWILPYFIYKSVRSKRSTKVSALIETHYDTIYDICEKASGLSAV